MPLVQTEGFAIHEGLLSRADVVHLLADLETSVESGRGGVRDVILQVPALREVAESEAVRQLVNPILGEHARVVRATLFDKTPASNWKVPWHQDVTIAVSERLECEGYGPWSVKAGVIHVQPPAHVLQEMLSVRVHLDDCPARNGALKVIPGSHRFGKVRENEIADVVKDGTEIICEVEAGGALLMRPLLIHSSSASLIAGHRRVLHFDYAWGALEGSLHWALS